MTDFGTSMRDDLLSAWRASSVANAAGIAAVTWAGTGFPHVFWGSTGLHGQRNAGRMPIVQMSFDTAGNSFDGAMADGGNLISNVLILVEVIKLPDWDTAETQARSIALAGMASMQGTHTFRVAAYTMEPAVETDFGVGLPIRVVVDQTYDNSDYTVV